MGEREGLLYLVISQQICTYTNTQFSSIALTPHTSLIHPHTPPSPSSLTQLPHTPSYTHTPLTLFSHTPPSYTLIHPHPLTLLSHTPPANTRIHHHTPSHAPHLPNKPPLHMPTVWVQNLPHPSHTRPRCGSQTSLTPPSHTHTSSSHHINSSHHAIYESWLVFSRYSWQTTTRWHLRRLHSSSQCSYYSSV